MCWNIELQRSFMHILDGLTITNIQEVHNLSLSETFNSLNLFKLLTIINSIFGWLGYDGNYSEESLLEFLKYFSAVPFNSSIHSFSYILM